MNVEVVSAGKSAFRFTFCIARVAARRPPVATAASVSLIALTGRAVVVDLLIAAFLAAVGENWRVSVFKRSWRLLDVLAEVLSGDKAECRVWKLAIDEAGVVFCCVVVIVALLRLGRGF